MKAILSILAPAGAVAISVFALSSFGTHAFGNSSRPDSDQEKIARGRYIVHGVGLCVDCHSPRDKTGQFLEGKHLTGAPIDFVATIPIPWRGVAPKIAGLPAGFSSEDMVHFLMTGERPNGRPAALPPMPPYRMNRHDAEAVTAYLHSLAPAN